MKYLCIIGFGFTMLSAIKCAIHVNRFLNNIPQCVKIISIRHYPRWSHRRPVGFVVEESSPHDWEQWKLKIEKEIREDHINKSKMRENSRPNPTGESISNITLRERVTDKSYEKQKINSESRRTEDNAKKVEIHYRRDYYQMQHKATPSDGYGDPTRNGKSNLNISTNETRTMKHKPSHQELVERRKIYAKEQIKEASELRGSAAKLGVPVFTDLGDDDTMLSQYLTNLKSQKKREKIGKILLEGKRLIRDAVDAGYIPEAVFFSRIKDLRDLNLPEDKVKIFKITYKKLCLWSDVITPQGVIAVLKTPHTREEGSTHLPLTVILDNIRDPGNLGTILRTCAGVGCRRVILTKGCVNLWEPKVLRAGAGAHFRLAVTQEKDWGAIMDSVTEGSLVCVADNISFCDSQFYKKRTVDSGSSTSTENDSDDSETSQSPDQKNKLSELMAPVVPYYAMNYTSIPSVVLIVGGETEGISSEAYRLVSETSGVRLNIPLSNNIESLNSCTALSIIAFEVKKQFLVNQNTTNAVVDVRTDDSTDSKVFVKNV